MSRFFARQAAWKVLGSSFRGARAPMGGLCLGATGVATGWQMLQQKQRHVLCDVKGLDSKVVSTGGTRTKVAIYGGAFDPVTNSHMTACAEIIHSGQADEVWLVPCGPRPDKPNLKTTAFDRYCMCQIAVNSVFSAVFPVKVSDTDVRKQEAAATYDLLCELRDANPDCDFSFVVGSDWLQPGTDISSWDSKNPAWTPGDTKVPEKIVTGHKMLAEFAFLVIKRPGYEVPSSDADPTGLKAFGPRLTWMEMPPGMTMIETNLSSTEVRKRVALAYRSRSSVRVCLQPIDGMVPAGVLGFISRRGLYE